MSASAPPGQEQAETNSLEHPGDSADRHGIKRPLLGKDLADKLQPWLANELIRMPSRGNKTYAGGRASEEDQGAKVSSTLVTESTGGVDQGSHTVGLYGTADKGTTPCSCGTSSFLRLDELLLRVGSLGAVVGVAEDRGENTQRGCVGEECTHRNSGWLHRRKVW